MNSTATKTVYLVRYGVIPEVARFVTEADTPLARNDAVIVQTHRGEQLGTVLERERSSSKVEEIEFAILRAATADDLARNQVIRQRCDAAIPEWMQRIAEWELQLELLEIEETFDGKTVLYVMCDRGPDSTKLALQAAAAGLGIIEVQPVNAEGLVPIESGGGGCGSGGCGCEH
ncbi:MAG TPA: hypothetical protein VFG20_12800 [Planctomycetaceae bacterium]|nr:hypothetical protein [Planctomycetaceae bacterium]